MQYAYTQSIYTARVAWNGCDVHLPITRHIIVIISIIYIVAETTTEYKNTYKLEHSCVQVWDGII